MCCYYAGIYISAAFSIHWSFPTLQLVVANQKSKRYIRFAGYNTIQFLSALIIIYDKNSLRLIIACCRCGYTCFYNLIYLVLLNRTVIIYKY